MSTRVGWYLLLSGVLACQHSDAVNVDVIEPLGPNEELHVGQLTFNPDNDEMASWSPDGRQILYVFTNDVRESPNISPGIPCFGTIPVPGGTRSYAKCDGLLSYTDSIVGYSAVSMRPNGQLLYLSAVARPGDLAPRRTILWVADTAAPFHHRTPLLQLPARIGDSVAVYLSESAWLDNNTFIGVAQKFLIFTDGPLATARDTLLIPLYLVQGTVTPQGATFKQIPGSANATIWARASDGNILFVRGFLSPSTIETPRLIIDPFVMRIPSGGGTPERFATPPDGGEIRGLTCAADLCLTLSNRLSKMSPITGALTVVTNLNGTTNFSGWEMPVLSPDGSLLLYRNNRNLYLTGAPN